MESEEWRSIRNEELGIRNFLPPAGGIGIFGGICRAAIYGGRVPFYFMGNEGRKTGDGGPFLTGQKWAKKPPRRRKLHIPRFRLAAKAHSLRCSSSPNRTRFAGLRLGPRKGGNRSRSAKPPSISTPLSLGPPGIYGGGWKGLLGRFDRRAVGGHPCAPLCSPPCHPCGKCISPYQQGACC